MAVLSFYERKEIKDILAYFRMVINPEDEEALKELSIIPKGDLVILPYRKYSNLPNIPELLHGR